MTTLCIPQPHGDRAITGCAVSSSQNEAPDQSGETGHRQRDGLDPAQLVEAVAIAIVDPGNHALRRFVVEPPHQRLVAEDGALAAIDDGLKGHGEVEVEICFLLTQLADGGGRGGRYIHDFPLGRGGAGHCLK